MWGTVTPSPTNQNERRSTPLIIFQRLEIENGEREGIKMVDCGWFDAVGFDFERRIWLQRFSPQKVVESSGRELKFAGVQKREMERNNTHSTNRDGLLLRSESRSAATTSSDFVLQWGNRKRLRCMKFQVKDHSNSINNSSGSGPAQRATARVDRRVVRSDLNNNSSKDPNSNQLNNNNNAGKTNGGGNGYLNLRRRPASPSHRILRNSDSSLAAAEVVVLGRRAAQDGRKGTGSSSGSGDAIAAMWPPKFVIALTNKEKEEDFMAIKGSKLPQRPKKRAKFIQRTLNLVSPGAWLCDLTLERYEVREEGFQEETKRVEGYGKHGLRLRVDMMKKPRGN
ncbi:hypothetical protein DH2020_025375 [Rehmannia glutinosa]|uniref:Uncharacterized protein n=1 Tax=Rehmannia glutinosa TaxID=99300 RepID=A0ABR0W2K7_REHGL